MDAQNLSRSLSYHYGLIVTSVIGLKTVSGVLCQNGSRYIWKPASPDASADRLWAIYEMTRALSNDGICLAGPLLNRHGSLLTVLADGSQGYLQPWLGGRHVNIRDRQERLSTLAAIAHLHRSAAEVQTGEAPVLYRATLYDKLHKKTDYFRGMLPRVQTAMPALADFQMEIFLVLEDVLEAVQVYLSQWDGVTSLSFCHRDVAPHNVLWAANREVSFIDFDQAGMDDPFIDVLQWSNHAVFLQGAQPGHFADVTAVYARCNPLPPEREHLLWRLLRFPDIFIRTVSDWVRSDCPAHQRHRLVSAAQRERNRWEMWARDVRNG